MPGKEIDGAQVKEEAVKPAGERAPEGVQHDWQDPKNADSTGKPGQGRDIVVPLKPVATNDAGMMPGPSAPRKRASISDLSALPWCNRTRHEVAKPLWALSEEEAANLLETEEASLLDFAECLDFDALMHDMDDKELSATLIVCPCAALSRSSRYTCAHRASAASMKNAAHWVQRLHPAPGPCSGCHSTTHRIFFALRGNVGHLMSGACRVCSSMVCMPSRIHWE
jgi:hypothetical protein